jgi:PadR family transcriptional regulator, regulatory protein PadR
MLAALSSVIWCRRGWEFKYYRLTVAGRKQLSAEESKWRQMTRAIARIMRPAKEG